VRKEEWLTRALLLLRRLATPRHDACVPQFAELCLGDNGIVGLHNPASCEPIRARGDQVFGERFCATTDGITSTDDSFPDEDFFLDISALYIDDMADDAGANANANVNLNVNVNPPAASYAICSYLFQFCYSFLY
jgi:hypothetical protein